MFRGKQAEIQDSTAPEVLLVGPADTGKTWAGLWHLHRLAMAYPLVGIIIRKRRVDMDSTVLATFRKLTKGNPHVNPYGGEKPIWYDYTSGARIWIAGIDNPGKSLGSEPDVVYVSQAEELYLNDWETLTSRANGRAGNLPYGQVIGDANPLNTGHWILERAKLGSLQVWNTRHADNPTLYDENGILTASGVQRLESLSKLTGVRRKRLFEGLWATAEGAVFDSFDRDIHVKERADTEMRYWALAMDEGYTHPAVILMVGVDGDGRLHVLREFYERGKLQASVVNAAVEMYSDRIQRGHEVKRDWRPVVVAVDAAAAGLVADLVNSGLPAESCKGRVLDNIAHLQNLLQVAGDGKPRLTVDPKCLNLINEFESFVWKKGKDEPVKEHDDAINALWYFCDWLYADTQYSRVGSARVQIGNY